jgi:hypothetical protein
MLLERTPVLVNCSLSQKYRTCLKQQRCLFFGAYYQEDVLGILERVKNIHNFMKTGWDGIAFYEALELKKII